MTGWEITRKDLQLLRRDRRALIVLIALPMAFICILGLTTGRLLGWRENNQLLSVCVIDDSNSELSNRLIDRLSEIEGLKIVRTNDAQRVRELLEQGDASAAISIGTAFERRAAGLTPSDFFDQNRRTLKLSLDQLDIDVDGRPGMAMVKSVVRQLVLLSAIRVVLPDVAERLGVLPKSQIPSAVRQLKTSPPEEQQDENRAAVGNPVYQTLVPAYTVMFAFFLVNIMARSFIAERELGTLKRLSMAPISEFQIVLGKTLPFLLISLIQCGALFLFGKLLFGMSWGTQPWLLVPIMLTTSLAATGLGLLVATLVRTDSQVSAYANFLVITLAGISGCFMPRDWLPETMQTFSLITPHAWALLAYDHSLHAEMPSVGLVMKSCAALTGFAVLFFALGVWRFRSKRI